MLYSIKHTYFVGSRVANRAYNSLAPVVPLRVVKFELFKAIRGSIAVELKFQLKLLRVKTNIRIGILHVVGKKKKKENTLILFSLNTSSCLGLWIGKKNNTTDPLTI